jgi:hypothetical protein
VIYETLPDKTVSVPLLAGLRFDRSLLAREKKSHTAPEKMNREKYI